VEKAIEVSVAQQSHRLSIVVCPTGVKREKGKTLVCIATLSRGQQIPFKVTRRTTTATSTTRRLRRQEPR